MRQVVPDSLSFYFEIVARDTACEGAALTLEQIATELRCAALRAAAGRRRSRPSAARTAARPTWQIVAGEELEVDYIEVEQRETACTA